MAAPTPRVSRARFPAMRSRRLRQDPWMRRLVRETRPSVDDLIWAIIVSDTVVGRQPIASLPGVERIAVSEVAGVAQQARALGIPALAILPHVDPKKKDRSGSESANLYGVVCAAVRAVKAAAPQLGVMTDVALAPFTDHGHSGIVRDNVIVNDATIDALVRAALVQAEAGADIIAASDMMDGRIGAIRAALEDAGHADVTLMSYAANFASALNGAEREALGVAQRPHGDSRSYLMDPANARDALRRAALDVDEGADLLMIKPGLAYLDILRDCAQAFDTPVFAFQDAGEHAMMAAAAANGWLDGERIAREALVSFKRAGARGIVTFGAPWLAPLLAQRED